MIKIFGGAGVVTPSKSPPPYEQLLPLPTPCFKMFLERSLNDPPAPHFKHPSLLPPPHPPPLLPPPPKNFDHTHRCRSTSVQTLCAYVCMYDIRDRQDPVKGGVWELFPSTMAGQLIQQMVVWHLCFQDHAEQFV